MKEQHAKEMQDEDEKVSRTKLEYKQEWERAKEIADEGKIS